MNENPTDGPRPQPQAAAGARLDSWKKIAAHFRRDVTTVQRWERREGMPVHRHLHDKQGSVYAFRAELDAWWETRRGRLPDVDSAVAEPPAEAGAYSGTGKARHRALTAAAVVGRLFWAYAGWSGFPPIHGLIRHPAGPGSAAKTGT